MEVLKDELYSIDTLSALEINNKSIERRDIYSILLLLLLYTIQGIPIGLREAIPIVINKRASYSEIAFFSLAGIPFCLKLVWAPILDFVYIKRFGKRKTWLIPVQLLCGILLLYGSINNKIDIWLGIDDNPVNTTALMIYFLLLHFLVATQDIAVDGWALTMLPSHLKHHASTCNAVGQAFGINIAFIGFITLNTQESCTTIYRIWVKFCKFFSIAYLNIDPDNEIVGPFVTLSGFTKFFGILIILCTLIISFKMETEDKPTIEEPDIELSNITIVKNELSNNKTIFGIYKTVKKISLLRPVRTLIFALVTKTIYSCLTEVSDLKLLEKGLPKDVLALMSPIMVPIEIIAPAIIARYIEVYTVTGLIIICLNLKIVSYIFNLRKNERKMVGIKTWIFGGTNKTPHSSITNNERKAHGRASMFFAGFIMLTPHRIAMTCAPHILKRYHLPPEVVPLFIYKIHAPMELSGLIGQLLTNIILWICRYSNADRRIFRGFSISFTWLMFFSTVLSFILLYSGSDYGHFNYFFWSIILMTFTNGLYCSSAFKLEGIIASMYGAGIPSSGFFTFFLHKFCKWSSVRFDWEDFDHSILKVQFWVTVITLFISSTIWTVDIGIDIWDTQSGGTSNTSIDFGNSAGTSGKLQNPLEGLKDKYEVKLEKDTQYKARPLSGTTGEITVEQVNEQTQHGGNTKYKGYRHYITGVTNTDRVNRITIYGHITDGILQTVLDGQQFNAGGGVYVYFPLDGSGNPELNKPLLICLSANGQAGSSNTWYKRETGNTWTDVSRNYDEISPGGTSNQIVQDLKDKLGPISPPDTGYDITDLVVKLDYAPKSDKAADIIKYRTGNKQVTVTPISGNNFKGYKHDLGDRVTIDKVKIHNTEITQIGIADLNGKRFVYVYYHKTEDPNLKKPYLICLAVTDGASRDNKWYKRTGNTTWGDADNFGETDDPNLINTFETKLGQIKDDLGSTDTGYTSTSNDIDASVTPTLEAVDKEALYGIIGKQITVTKTNGKMNNGVPSDYVSYVHKLPTDGQFTLSSVKHNGIALEGIPTNTANVTAVCVYYTSEDTDHEFPLIVCVKKGNNTQTYYKRGNTWDVEPTLKNVDPDGLDPDKEEANKGIHQLFDTNAADWSPISMLACSLGTVYFFIHPLALISW